MQKWEYLTLKAEFNRDTGDLEIKTINSKKAGTLAKRGGILGVDEYNYPNLHTYLNDLGQKGWEAINISSAQIIGHTGGGSYTNGMFILLKRPL